MPQWNCACPNCQAARSNQIPRRTQSSVAVSGSVGEWFLVNASPDLPAQTDAHPELRPNLSSARNTPIRGVLLTNADLDHVLGLLALREGGPLSVWAPKTVRQVLDARLNLTGLLDAFCGVSWQEPAFEEFAPLTPGRNSILCRAIALPGGAPPFAGREDAGGPHSVAYQFMDSRTGRRLLVAPDVASLNSRLRQALSESDIILFDGTFWSGEELGQIKRGAPQASEMGHLTIKDCSLQLLRELKAREKVLIHINNTNPVLAPGSPERAGVEAAGVRIGFDGQAFEL